MITTPAEMEASDRTEEPIEEIKRPDAGPRPAPTTEARSVIGLQDLRQRIYATAKAGRVRMEKGGVAIGCTARLVCTTTMRCGTIVKASHPIGPITHGEEAVGRAWCWKSARRVRCGGAWKLGVNLGAMPRPYLLSPSRPPQGSFRARRRAHPAKLGWSPATGSSLQSSNPSSLHSLVK